MNCVKIKGVCMCVYMCMCDVSPLVTKGAKILASLSYSMLCTQFIHKRMNTAVTFQLLRFTNIESNFCPLRSLFWVTILINIPCICHVDIPKVLSFGSCCKVNSEIIRPFVTTLKIALGKKSNLLKPSSHAMLHLFDPEPAETRLWMRGWKSLV